MRISVRVAAIATAVLMIATAIPQTAAQAAGVPGTYVAVTPTRLLDTRSGTGASKAKIGAGKALVLQVGGKAGLPTSGVSAVALNVNALNSTAGGRIIVYADGTTRPEMSSVNFVAGRPGTSLVVSRVSSAGKVALYNTSSQPVDVVADLSGYFVGGSVTIPGGFVAVPPARSLDTRNAIGADREDMLPNGPDGPVDFTWQVAGRNGVPSTGASAVVMSVTITNATRDDVVALYPSQSDNLMQYSDDAQFANLRGISFVAGRPVTNLYVVPLGADGRVRMTQQPFTSGGTFDAIADVVGYTRSGIVTTPGAYQIAPSRTLSRGGYSIAAGATVTTKAIADPGAVAPFNLTVSAGASAGALVAHEAGTTRPPTRNVNFLAGEKVSNTVIVKTSAAGAISMTNSSASTINVSVDAAGYFRGSAPASKTLWATGVNAQGQLAAGGEPSLGSDLVAPTLLSGIKQVYAGDYEHEIFPSYALMANGTVRAWGSWGTRDFSELTGNPLGLGDTVKTTVPTQIPNISYVIDVAASTGGAFFLQTDGTVWGTGDGQQGQLLNTVPEFSGVDSPVKLPGLTGITSIGRQFAAKADGSVVTWDRAGVRTVPSISDAVDLNDSYALRRNGTLARLTSTGAVPVNGLSNVIAINNRFALTSSGAVWVLPTATVPGLHQVDGLANVTTLGSYGPAALKADGSVWIWKDGAIATRVANVPPMSGAYKADGPPGSWESLFMVSR